MVYLILASFMFYSNENQVANHNIIQKDYFII